MLLELSSGKIIWSNYHKFSAVPNYQLDEPLYGFAQDTSGYQLSFLLIRILLPIMLPAPGHGLTLTTFRLKNHPDISRDTHINANILPRIPSINYHTMLMIWM
jgi:hypothetical protein